MMAGTPDFDEHEVYRAVRAMTGFIYDLEDRFPADEVTLLYYRLRCAAVDLGARIAEGFGRAGVSGPGDLPGTTLRDARGKLSEMKHYFLVSRDRFLLDEQHEREFMTHYETIREALDAAGGND